uniref:Integrase core domain-containing protein n=1 Tax=Magallana gigas TaxID=29159 RepID=K1Q1M5_MAGGI
MQALLHIIDLMLITSAPRCVRLDAGTENIYIEDIQKSFRWYHDDDMCGKKSVIIGRSMSNQRIERWWRTLREMGISFWIHLFKDMEDQGMFSLANNEHIAQRRYDDDGSLPGKPDMMFFHPEIFGAVDYKFPVDICDVLEFQRLFPSPSPRGCCEDYAAYFDHLLLDGGRTVPQTIEKAIEALNYLIKPREYTIT